MKKLKKSLIIMILIILIAIGASYTYTFAKYVSNKVWDYVLESKGFYFSSDYLSSEGIKTINNIWDGEAVFFNIMNIQNDSLITEYDIKYEATCEIIGPAADHATCLMNGNDNNTFSGTLSTYQACFNQKNDGVEVNEYPKAQCELEGYKWETQKATGDIYFEINLVDTNYELTDVNVKVNVKSTSPYKKTLTGEFNLKNNPINKDKVIKEYLDLPNSGRLNLTNLYSEAKCVNITWNADNLLIDEEKEVFEDYGTSPSGYINDIKVIIEPNTNASYLFYKTDTSSEYSISEFVIYENSSC